MSRDRDWSGKFSGRRERLNVEDLPRLPVLVASQVLADPLDRPYLVLWASRETEGEAVLALRVERAGDHHMLVTDQEGWSTRIEFVRRTLSRGGGWTLLYRCPHCGARRRHLFLTRNYTPRCRACQGLRFESEGRYRSRRLLTLLEHLGQGQPVAALSPQLELAALSLALGPGDREPWDPDLVVSHPVLAFEHFSNIRIQEVAG